MSYCPKCNKRFEEATGFCPFDGTTLAEGEPKSVRALSAREDPKAAVASLSGRGRDEYEQLLGQTLDGRYLIEKKLGEGGMGVVFLARHVVIEKPVAIKVLKREIARDRSVVTRFVQEAKAASRIGHPNIIDVTDFGSTPEGLTYQVMEFLDGATLSRATRGKGALSIERALAIAAQIGRALAAAHDKGIVHRDLKPENIFLIDRGGRTDFVKIVDFGIAKVAPLDQSGVTPRLTRAGSVFGTPEYMAPEQASGRGDTDHRVDVYALGIILYEMLVGRVPLKGDSPVRTIAMQMLDPITPPREARPGLDISSQLEEVVMRALAKKRDDRYQTMNELVEALEGAFGGPLDAGSASSAVPALPPRKETDLQGPETEVDAFSPHEDVETIRAPRAARAVAAATVRKPRASSAHDPAFVGDSRGIRYDLLEPSDTVPQAEERRGPWTMLAASLLVLAAVGVGVVLMVRGGRGDPGGEQAGGAAADAAVAVAAADSAEVPAIAAGGDEGLADAGTAVALGPVPDAGGAVVIRKPGGKNPQNPDNPAGPLQEVVVISRPQGAQLYIGTDYAGTAVEGGVNLRRPAGTRLSLVCRLRGYEPGKVEVVFGGPADVFLCRLGRERRCIPGLQNPFDNCPE